MRRRVGVTLVLDLKFTFIRLTPYLGTFFLVDIGLGDIELRGGIGSRGYLIGIEGVNPGFHALLLSEPGQAVVIEALRRPAMLAPVAAELLGWLV